MTYSTIDIIGFEGAIPNTGYVLIRYGEDHIQNYWLFNGGTCSCPL